MTVSTAVPTPPRMLSTRWTAALAAGAALLVAGTGITPATPTGDPAGLLAVFAEHPMRAALGGLAFLLGHMLLVGPFLRLSRLGGLAGGAATVAALGAVPFGALGLARMFEVALATTLEPVTGARVLEEFESMPVAALAILPGVAAVNLGLIVLAVALWRSQLLPAWTPLLVIAGIAGVMSGGDGTATGMIGSALLGLFVVLLSTVRDRPQSHAAA